MKVSEQWEKIAVGWCKLMHTEVGRPMHGRYQCLTCKRYYPVPWEPALLRERTKPVSTLKASSALNTMGQ